MPELKLNIQRKIADFELDMAFSVKNAITGIFGPSGAGKSSLFNSIAGIINPDKGIILLNGRILFSSADHVNLAMHKRRVGLVFQDFKLFPHLNVKANLLFSNEAKNNPRFEEVVEMLKIQPLLKRKPDKLSGGEKQRVSIGRTILSQPEILLFDEPFSALDMKIKSEIIEFIKKIPEQFNIPVLIISHELSDLLQLSTKLILIKNGKVLNYGNLYDLFSDRASIKLLSHSGLKNILELKVGFIDHDKEMICLSHTKSVGKIKVIINDLQPRLKIGANVKLFLPPEDVAIALQPIENISIQNQLPGIVDKIFYINGKMICMVDAGIKIMAEISRSSVEILGLKPGKTVWCLFKSVSPRII